MSLQFHEKMSNAKTLMIEAISLEKEAHDIEINRLKSILLPISVIPENGKIYKIRCEDNSSLALDIGPCISNRSKQLSIILKPNSDSKTQEWKCIHKNGDLTFENVSTPAYCLDKYNGRGNLSDKRMVLYKINNTDAQKFNFNIETGLIKTCNGYLSVINNQIFSTPSSTQKFVFECIIVPPQLVAHATILSI